MAGAVRAIRGKEIMAGAVRAIRGVSVAQDFLSKRAAQVTRRHSRATTAAAEVVAGPEDENDGERRDHTLGISGFSPPRRSGGIALPPRLFATSEVAGLRLLGGHASWRFGVGDPVDNDDDLLGDLEPNISSGLPPRRSCAIALLPRQFSISELTGLRLFSGHAPWRFGVGDPVGSDDHFLFDLDEGLSLHRCGIIGSGPDHARPPWLDISQVAERLGLFDFGVEDTVESDLWLFDQASPRTSGLPHRQCHAHGGSIAWRDTNLAMRPLAVCGISCLQRRLARRENGISCLFGFSDGDHVLQATSRAARLLCSTSHILSRSRPHPRAAANSSACVWPPFGIHGARRLSSWAPASPPAPGTSVHQATASGSSPGPSSPQPPTGCSWNSSSSSADDCSELERQEEWIDETSTDEVSDVKTYLQSKPFLIQVTVSGSTKTFWRLSDDGGYLIRPLAEILRNHHAKGYYLSGPLLSSNVFVTDSGRVKLKNVKFVKKSPSPDHLNQDYKYLAKLIKELVVLSNGIGGLRKLPPDFKKYLKLLECNNLKEKDEFLLVNHCSLLPMSNRGDVFLMFYDHIVTLLGHKDKQLSNKIIHNLKYDYTWIRTAFKNTELRKWLAHRWYKRNQAGLLHFNRNVRSHKYEHTDSQIEETLYCAWPKLLVDMQEELHEAGELEKTAIASKFGR